MILGAKKLKNQNDLDAAKKSSELEEMTRNLAHEINSPLSTISLQAENIIETIHEANKDDIAASAESILLNVDRITRIVKAVRAYSRMNFKSPFLPYLVDKIIHDVVTELRPRFEEQQVELFIEPYDLDHKLDCRATEVHQVLTNLLRNSMDAIHETKDPWVRIQVTKTRDTTEFRITDSGTGIPEEHQKQIFEPLFSTKSRSKNMGVGLALCSKIAEVHGGKLRLDTSTKNTSFVFSLPNERSGLFGNGPKGKG